MALKKIHPNSWKLWMLYHRAMDVIKDLEIGRLSGIIQVSSVKSQGSDKRKVKVLVTKAYPLLDLTDYRL